MLLFKARKRVFLAVEESPTSVLILFTLTLAHSLTHPLAPPPLSAKGLGQVRVGECALLSDLGLGVCLDQRENSPLVP